MTESKSPPQSVQASDNLHSRVLDEIKIALQDLRYGSIEITVHDGKVTQIEAKRKIRL